MSETDAEGAVTQRYAETRVRGRAEEMSSSDVDRVTQVGKHADVAVTIPPGVDVAEDVVVAVRGLVGNPEFDGEYRVVSVTRARRTPTRLTCARDS